ncbi:MAG: hypothetical protein IBX71_10580 [Candidatus Desulforudis sp.]|nr:hypothetical protein [Desulforudis sp.]
MLITFFNVEQGQAELHQGQEKIARDIKEKQDRQDQRLDLHWQEILVIKNKRSILDGLDELRLASGWNDFNPIPTLYFFALL